MVMSVFVFVFVFVGMSVMMMIVYVVDVFYSRRYGHVGWRLWIEHPAEEQHQQGAGQRE
jgi:hypothetical protein